MTDNLWPIEIEANMIQQLWDEPDQPPLVLVIDDDTASVALIIQHLQDAGYRTSHAEQGETGLIIAERYQPDVIILDVDMPDIDGFKVCEELKSRLCTTDIPVIFLTGVDYNESLVTRCFELGASELLTKPFNKTDFLARVRVVLRERALREAYRRLATEDPATGLLNRRQFFLYATEGIMAARTHRTPTVLAITDIDNLVAINDRFGHEFGDEVVITFSRILRRLAGQDCRIGRIGGDEFALVLMNHARDRAAALCERLSKTFSAVAFDADTKPKHFSASFGLAEYRGDPVDFDADQLMLRADIALCYAKQIARGRVAAHWLLDPQSAELQAPEKRHARGKTRKRTQHAYVVAPPAAESTEPAPNPPADAASTR